MKISDLIAELEKIKEAEGDIPCVLEGCDNLEGRSNLWQIDAESLEVLKNRNICRTISSGFEVEKCLLVG